MSRQCSLDVRMIDLMYIHVLVRIIKKIVDFLIGLLKDQPEIVTFSGFITFIRFF